jgi:hypothetical protein
MLKIMSHLALYTANLMLISLKFVFWRTLCWLEQLFKLEQRKRMNVKGEEKKD